MATTPPTAGRAPALLALVAVSCVTACLAACAAPESAPPDVLLISLDTVRRDALESGSMPALEALGRDGVVFERAFVPMGFTLPSHMSMLTGLHPGSHGVVSDRHALAAEVASLPELLRSAGYRTEGIVTNDWLKGEFGFGRGFDRYEKLPHEPTYADRVFAAGLEALDRARAAGEPLFLFLHVQDPHSDFVHVPQSPLPYYSPPELRRDLELPEGGREFCTPDGRCATDFLFAAHQEGRRLPEPVLELLHQLYLRGVRYADDRLGELLAELEARGVYRRSLIVVVSDHGEEFQEHGRFTHSQTYDETIAVPLVVKLPGGEHAGRRVAGLVDVADLMPTVLDALGLAVPEDLQGRSLLPAIRGEEGGRRFVVSQDKLRQSRYALRTRDWKLVYDRASGDAELYDLRADPGEKRNLATEEGERLETMKARLLAFLDHDLQPPPASTEAEADLLTPEERERLRSLGYLQ